MMLAGMMSPPSGYSSGDEDRPAYANAQVLASVQEEVQRLQAEQARDGADARHASAASAPAVLLNSLVHAAGGSAPSGGRVRDASPGGSDDTSATPSSSSASLAASPRSTAPASRHRRLATPPQALGMNHVTAGEPMAGGQGLNILVATPVRTASLPPVGGSPTSHSSGSRAVLPASPLRQESGAAAAGLQRTSLGAGSISASSPQVPIAASAREAATPPTTADTSQGAAAAAADSKLSREHNLTGGLNFERSSSPSSSSSGALHLGSLGGMSSESAAVPPPATPSPQEATSMSGQQVTPLQGSGPEALDDPLSVDQPESIGLMADQQVEGEQEEEEEEEKGKEGTAEMNQRERKGEAPSQDPPHMRSASPDSGQGLDKGSSGQALGVSPPQPALSLAGSSSADGYYLGDVDTGSHGQARHERSASVQSEAKQPLLLPLSPQPSPHKHQVQRALLQSGHPAGVAPLSPFQVGRAARTAQVRQAPTK
jgi:hypothetical protein